MYPSNRSLNIPRACPGHLTSFSAREGGELTNLAFSLPGVGHLITTHRGVGNLIARLGFILRVAVIPRGVTGALTFKIKERACFVFLAAMFIFRGLLVQGLEPRF